MANLEIVLDFATVEDRDEIVTRLQASMPLPDGTVHEQAGEVTLTLNRAKSEDAGLARAHVLVLGACQGAQVDPSTVRYRLGRWT